jgi:hypothetical protein
MSNYKSYFDFDNKKIAPSFWNKNTKFCCVLIEKKEYMPFIKFVIELKKKEISYFKEKYKII